MDQHKMIQQEKVPAANSDNQSSISRTHMLGGEDQPPPLSLYIYIFISISTHRIDL